MKVQSSPVFPLAFSELRLTVTYSGYVTTDESWRQPPLPTSISRLYFVEEGSGMLISSGERMALEPGHVYLAPCGMPCGYFGTDAVKKLFFHINLTDGAGRDLFLDCRHFAALEFSVERIRELTALYFSGESVAQLRLKAALFDVVGRFLSDPCCTVGVESALPEAVTRAIAYIRANPRADLTVREIADACFVSPALLGRFFRERMHIGVARYVEELLMLEARRRLSLGRESIGQISESLGYCDQFYFSRRFKALFGVPPKEYRKNQSYT